VVWWIRGCDLASCSSSKRQAPSAFQFHRLYLFHFDRRDQVSRYFQLHFYVQQCWTGAERVKTSNTVDMVDSASHHQNPSHARSPPHSSSLTNTLLHVLRLLVHSPTPAPRIDSGPPLFLHLVKVKYSPTLPHSSSFLSFDLSRPTPSSAAPCRVMEKAMNACPAIHIV
jgi:hypothetical protein